MYTVHPLVDIPVTKYYFETFIVGAHSSMPHLLTDLWERKHIALVELNKSLPHNKIEALKTLIQMIEDKIDSIDPSVINELEDAEPTHWINKLGRQSALEISTYGRIRPETMHLLMCLPEENFIAAMSIAGRLSNKIQALGEQAMLQEVPVPQTMPVVT
jgi:hypothetical protein